jgi:hypothetical protein
MSQNQSTLSESDLQPLIDKMNNEEKKYLTFVYNKLKQAEEKQARILDVYRNVEAEVYANQNAIEIWLNYIQNKYQELSNDRPSDSSRPEEVQHQE